MVAACVAILVSGALATASAAYPPCFGAASRDPVHPCHNPALDQVVIPTPAEAQIMPNTLCEPIELDVCTFGLPTGQATGSAALIGDSHAWQWRPAMEVVANALGWQAFNATRSSCPFTAGVTLLPEPKQAGCSQWNRELPVWFAHHPEVGTAFVSDHPGPVVRHSQSLTSAQIRGYIGAWESLPPTVKHIVVIRDIPYMHEATFSCIEAAVHKHKYTGDACAVPRYVALRADPEILATERLHSPRVQAIDLTRYFCDPRLCYPVVGGALAYRDYDHVTPVFATTVGPYLLRALDSLMTSWG